MHALENVSSNSHSNEVFGSSSAGAHTEKNAGMSAPQRSQHKTREPFNLHVTNRQRLSSAMESFRRTVSPTLNASVSNVASLSNRQELGSYFDSVPSAPVDPLIGVTAAFKQDPNPNKVDLGVGAYRDDNGVSPVMDCIKKVEDARAEKIREGTYKTASYLPSEGLLEFNNAVKTLVFGNDKAVHDRTATVQGLGGTGPIRLGADYIKKVSRSNEVWISEPSWPAHRMVFEGAGFTVKTYPYYDKSKNGVDFDSMLAKLKNLPPESVVVLQACCHNPTGADLTDHQWQQVIATVKEKKLIPFIDMAYQGFAESLEADGKVVRDFARENVEVIVSTSYSKNLGQYGERVGALSVVKAPEKTDQMDNVMKQLRVCVRNLYSNPPTRGAETVAAVLNDPELSKSWVNELGTYRDRLKDMRQQFVSKLRDIAPEHNFDFVLEQRGMFAFLPLSPQQVVRMREEDSIYLIETGRMCVANLNSKNIDAVVKSVAKVLAQPEQASESAQVSAPVVQQHGRIAPVRSWDGKAGGMAHWLNKRARGF